ncbi:META domain-containing protein [Marinobacter sp.]|uniref:META domain-containing protein n=1 Tax=Marinobacter sp. TaxID=50741 RepID=UPI0034A2DE70
MTLKKIVAASVVLVAAMLTTGCASSVDSREIVEPPAERMYCGQATIDLDYRPSTGRLVLTHGDKKYQMKHQSSASGARFVRIGDARSVFWSKGDTASLSLEGYDYPECRVGSALGSPFSARGNEPFWRIALVGNELTLSRLEEATETLVSRVAERNDKGQTLRAGRDGLGLTMDVAPQLCVDSMSGMPYPNQVRLRLNDEVMTGCGGDPERLLQGVEWVVDDIGGYGAFDESQVTIAFLNDNRLVGQASCNRYTGSWTLTGEVLLLDLEAGTLMACDQALVEQEQRFLEIMAEVNGFSIAPGDELILSTPSGKTLRAYPPSGKP